MFDPTRKPFVLVAFIMMAGLFLTAGIVQVTLPNAVPTANKRGNTNVFQLAANNSTSTAGTLFCDDGSGNVTTSGCSTGGTTATITIANASSTGTTTSTITKLTGAPSTAVIAATTDTGGTVGICTSGCTTSGNATIQIAGSVNCVFDGATTAGDYVQISSSTAGNCHDTASTYPTSGQVIGRVLSTNGSGGTYSIDLFPAEIKAASGGGSVTSVGGLTGAVPGGWVLVEQHTASSSAALQFTTGITSTYDNYVCEIIDVIPASASQAFLYQVSTNGGSSYDSSSNYYYGTDYIPNTGSGGNLVGNGVTSVTIFTSIDNTVSNGGISGNFFIYAPGNTSSRKASTFHVAASQSGAFYAGFGSSTWNLTTAVNAFQFFFASGNIASGTIRCYGIAKQ